MYFKRLIHGFKSERRGREGKSKNSVSGISWPTTPSTVHASESQNKSSLCAQVEDESKIFRRARCAIVVACGRRGERESLSEQP